MKIAVFSDIHGNMEALKVVLEQIKEKNVELTVFLGDIFQRGNEEIECMELLKCNEIICLKGNCSSSNRCRCFMKTNFMDTKYIFPIFCFQILIHRILFYNCQT